MHWQNNNWASQLDPIGSIGFVLIDNRRMNFTRLKYIILGGSLGWLLRRKSPTNCLGFTALFAYIIPVEKFGYNTTQDCVRVVCL
jgi:hypothetical protein